MHEEERERERERERFFFPWEEEISETERGMQNPIEVLFYSRPSARASHRSFIKSFQRMDMDSVVCGILDVQHSRGCNDDVIVPSGVDHGKIVML